jgi:fumarate reductase subunit D
MMFKGEKKRDSLELFLTPLVVVVVIFALLVLPYALTESYGLEEKKLISLMTSVVLAVFAVDMLIFWIVRYRQTSHDIETLRKGIEKTRLFHMRQREIWQRNSQRHSKR